METLKRLLMRLTHRYVHSNVKIGKGTYIHPTAVIYDGVTIGENCYIGAYCIIGAPAEYPLQDMNKEFNGVEIGDNCQLHGHNTVDAGQSHIPLRHLFFPTKILNNVTLMKGAHIGHNCEILSDVTLSCGVKVGGFSIISEKSTVGLNATIHQKSVIPFGSMLGAGSFFKGKSTNALKVWVGAPAKPIKENSVLLHRLSQK